MLIAELLATYTVETVLIILLIGVPAIVKGIGAAKNLWKKRDDFIKEKVELGHEEEYRKEQDENEKKTINDRIAAAEKNIQELIKLQRQQSDLMAIQIKSDKLAIKAWIKEQHDFWVPKGYIDSLALELLEERYEIYTQEHGNSWAEKLMNELRALPLVIPADKDKNKN